MRTFKKSQAKAHFLLARPLSPAPRRTPRKGERSWPGGVWPGMAEAVGGPWGAPLLVLSPCVLSSHFYFVWEKSEPQRWSQS